MRNPDDQNIESEYCLGPVSILASLTESITSQMSLNLRGLAFSGLYGLVASQTENVAFTILSTGGFGMFIAHNTIELINNREYRTDFKKLCTTFEFGATKWLDGDTLKNWMSEQSLIGRVVASTILKRLKQKYKYFQEN